MDKSKLGIILLIVIILVIILMCILMDEKEDVMTNSEEFISGEEVVLISGDMEENIQLDELYDIFGNKLDFSNSLEFLGSYVINKEGKIITRMYSNDGGEEKNKELSVEGVEAEVKSFRYSYRNGFVDSSVYFLIQDVNDSVYCGYIPDIQKIDSVKVKKFLDIDIIGICTTYTYDLEHVVIMRLKNGELKQLEVKNMQNSDEEGEKVILGLKEYNLYEHQEKYKLDVKLTNLDKIKYRLKKITDIDTNEIVKMEDVFNEYQKMEVELERQLFFNRRGRIIFYGNGEHIAGYSWYIDLENKMLPIKDWNDEIGRYEIGNITYEEKNGKMILKSIYKNKYELEFVQGIEEFFSAEEMKIIKKEAKELVEKYKTIEYLFDYDTERALFELGFYEYKFNYEDAIENGNKKYINTGIAYKDFKEAVLRYVSDEYYKHFYDSKNAFLSHNDFLYVNIKKERNVFFISSLPNLKEVIGNKYLFKASTSNFPHTKATETEFELLLEENGFKINNIGSEISSIQRIELRNIKWENNGIYVVFRRGSNIEFRNSSGEVFEGNYEIGERTILINLRNNLNENLELGVSLNEKGELILIYIQNGEEIILETDGKVYFNLTEMDNLKAQSYKYNEEISMGDLKLGNIEYNLRYIHTRIDGREDEEKLLFYKENELIKSLYITRPRSSEENPAFKEKTLSVFMGRYLMVYERNEWGIDGYLKFFDENLELVEEYYIESGPYNLMFEDQKITYRENIDFMEDGHWVSSDIIYEIIIENGKLQRNIIFQSEPEWIIT